MSVYKLKLTHTFTRVCDPWKLLQQASRSPFPTLKHLDGRQILVRILWTVEVESSRLPVPKKLLQDNHQKYAHYSTHNRSASPVKYYNARPVSMVPSESTPFIPIYGINCNDGVTVTDGIRNKIIRNFHYLHIYYKNCSTSSKWPTNCCELKLTFDNWFIPVTKFIAKQHVDDPYLSNTVKQTFWFL